MKTYVKPELRFESYELNHSVADCGWELRMGDEKTCVAVADPNFGLEQGQQAFIEKSLVCTWQPADYCYQNSVGMVIPLFRS